MTQEELKKIKIVLQWADNYFTDYCDIKGISVYDQDEIDQIEDEDERQEAQDDRHYEDLLFEANKILEKYLK